MKDPILTAVANTCDSCAECHVTATKINTKEEVTIQANMCQDGSGDIDVTVRNSDGDIIEECKFSAATDSCESLGKYEENSEDLDCGCS